MASDILLAALDTIVKCSIVLLGALATVHFAFKRFTKETLWSRKFEAYAKILDALYYRKMSAQESLDQYERYQLGESSPTYSEDYKVHLKERQKQEYKASDEMERILATGRLIISSEARAFLIEETKPRSVDWESVDLDPPGFWEKEIERYDGLIKRMENFAERDLGILSR